MARLYLDARNITDTPSGVGRYARCLIRELVGAHPDHEWVLVRHPSNREPIETPHPDSVRDVFVRWNIGEVPDQALGSWSLQSIFEEVGAPDLYHSLFHTVPFGLENASPEGRFPIVVTLHDLIWLNHPQVAKPNWLAAQTLRALGRVAIPHALKAADHVISVSEPTARRAGRWLDREETSVIEHGVESVFFDKAPVLDDVDAGPLPEDRYVVAVGNDKAYKNLRRLLGAIHRIDGLEEPPAVVLVGSCEGLRASADALGISDRVYLPGFVDDEALRAILGGADLFVFPSLVEGFGLPVLEAMALGTPAVVSDREPMRSVAGGAAELVDPTDTDALAAVIERLWSDSEARSTLETKGRERASAFRWPETAARTWEVYEAVGAVDGDSEAES